MKKEIKLSQRVRDFGISAIDWLQGLPVVGHAFSCSKRDHKSAMSDFAITIAFSTVTFWLSALILKIFKVNSEASYWSLLESTFQGGELFILTLGFLGPILIAVVDDFRKPINFPSGRSLLFLLFVLALVCSALFAVLKADNVHGAGGLGVDRDLAVTISVWVVAFACALRYLSITYHKSLNNFTAEDMQSGETTFKNDFSARHNKG